MKAVKLPIFHREGAHLKSGGLTRNCGEKPQKLTFQPFTKQSYLKVIADQTHRNWRVSLRKRR